ncbi:hypothetical protein ACVU7I_03600 [Patulibacter sp. S7RM1-6]
MSRAPRIRSADAAAHGRRRPDPEGGWVLVPVMALLVVGLLLSFAALVLVDRQTRASSEERDLDATQTLAEGVVTSTANVLAEHTAASDWSSAGCQRATGTLTDRAAAPDTLEGRVTAAVQRVFRDDAKDTAYARNGRTVRWTARVCPTTDAGKDETDRRFDSAVLARTTRTGSVDGRRTLWVAAQVNVKRADGTVLRSGAVARKIREEATTFEPPTSYALATGSLSTDLGTATSDLLKSVSNSPLLLDGLLGKTLGTNGKALIENHDARIGLRCGLLTGLEHTTSVVDPQALDLRLCLGGVLAGVNGIGQATGLDTLLDPLLGKGRYTTLDSFSVAPPAVADAYRNAAQSTGVYRDVGEVAGTTDPVKAPQCDVPWSTVTSATVVFLEQTGDGEQYCTIPPGTQAKAIVVARGRVIVRGPKDSPPVKSLIYMLNLNECDGAPTDTGCTPEFRSAHRGPGGAPRELVRIEGGGSVTGAVWTDGAYSQVGLHPATADDVTRVRADAARVLTDSLARTADTAICQVGGRVPLVGPLLTSVTKLLGGLLDGLGTLLGGKIETQIQPTSVTVQPRSSAPNVDTQACGLLGTALRTLDPYDRLRLTISGGTVPIGSRVWIRRVPGILGWDSFDWRPATDDEIRRAGFTLPGDVDVDASAASSLSQLLLGGANTLTELQNALVNVFSNRTAITLDAQSSGVLPSAAVDVPSGAATVPGSFRTIAPIDPGL